MVKLAANLSFLFKEKPFLDRFGAAAACGFRAVEFMFPGDGAYSHEAEEVAEKLNRKQTDNSKQTNITTATATLTTITTANKQKIRCVHTALLYARVMNCSKVHVMAGLRQHGASEDVFVERVRWASELAAEQGLTICIEPLNCRDFPGYLVPDTKTALDLIQRIDRPQSCKLQLDLYHLQISEGDLSENIRRLLPFAAHVQLANPPGRNEPGHGEVNFPSLLALLDDLGYDGHVGLEYNPSSTTLQSLEWARSHGIFTPSSDVE
ncbi:unnamed protein product [Polarella glacialis]|uniref:Putative hydroxypyruvate isomerase n=1 Tax=Polarella glacialis TaxID=89957 RepID=A0A813FEP6_POLGL|nr:unnamed protein product [Polarella glacialis]